jgi:hypothetical protein
MRAAINTPISRRATFPRTNPTIPATSHTPAAKRDNLDMTDSLAIELIKSALMPRVPDANKCGNGDAHGGYDCCESNQVAALACYYLVRGRRRRLAHE